MASILSKLRSEYKSEYFLNYTKPKIYHGGKNFNLSKRWYVYYDFRNPITGKMVRQPPVYYHVNRDYKTKAERLKVIKELRDVVENILKEKWSPYQNKESKKYTIESALDFALSIKKCTLAKKTYKDYESRLSHFKEYLSNENLLTSSIKDIDRKTVNFFLNNVLKESSARNRNNTKAVLSALFSVLEDNDMITRNFIKNIKKENTTPQKNKAFTFQEVEAIFKRLKNEDIWLYYYYSHVYYGLFRPVEVARIKVKNINLKDGLIQSNTKTGEYYKQIPNILVDQFYSKIDLKVYDKEHFLFTKFDMPSSWLADEESRRGYFWKRLKRIIIPAFNFSSEYTSYSLRHSAIGKIFVEKIQEYQTKKVPNFEEKALDYVRTITLHKNIETVREYLREIGYYKIDDWSKLLQ